LDRKERQSRVARLVDHAENPCHKGVLDGAQVVMPGGSPECGGSVVVYLKSEGNGGIDGASFTGEGDTISQGATDIVIEKVLREGLSMDEVLALDYDAFVGTLGREVIGSRTRNATLGLSTLKSAIRQYRRNGRSTAAERGLAQTP
jgi:nitrogen fixation NifU-like protein